MEYVARVENQSSLRSAAYLEQHSYIRWLHTAIGFLESALRGAEDADFSDDGSLRLRAPSSICRLHSDHARLFVSVADTHHLNHVSYSRDDVRQACAARRKRNTGGVWGGISPLYVFDARVFSSFERRSAEQRGIRCLPCPPGFGEVFRYLNFTRPCFVSESRFPLLRTWPFFRTSRLSFLAIRAVGRENL